MKIFDTWKQQLKTLESVYGKICESVDITIESAATEMEIKELETYIGCPLPVSLKEFFLFGSKHIDFSAFLPDEFELPSELREIFSAAFTVSIEEVKVAEEDRKSWINACFSDPDNDYDRVWHNKLGFMTVANGDIIAFDLDDWGMIKKWCIYLMMMEKAMGLF